MFITCVYHCLPKKNTTATFLLSCLATKSLNAFVVLALPLLVAEGTTTTLRAGSRLPAAAVAARLEDNLVVILSSEVLGNFLLLAFVVGLLLLPVPPRPNLEEENHKIKKSHHACFCIFWWFFLPQPDKKISTPTSGHLQRHPLVNCCLSAIKCPWKHVNAPLSIGKCNIFGWVIFINLKFKMRK